MAVTLLEASSSDTTEPKIDTVGRGGVVSSGPCQSLAEATVIRLGEMPRMASALWNLQKCGVSAFSELQDGFPPLFPG